MTLATNKPVKVFAWIALLLGLTMAVMYVLTGDPSEARVTDTTDTNFFDASSKSIQPGWYNFTIPFVAFFGILVGGRLHRRRPSE